jgi:hypothetical protein
VVNSSAVRDSAVHEFLSCHLMVVRGKVLTNRLAATPGHSSSAGTSRTVTAHLETNVSSVAQHCALANGHRPSALPFGVYAPFGRSQRAGRIQEVQQSWKLTGIALTVGSTGVADRTHTVVAMQVFGGAVGHPGQQVRIKL